MSLSTDIQAQIDDVQGSVNGLMEIVTNSVNTLNDLVEDIDTNYRLSYATVNFPEEIIPAEPSGKPGDWTGELTSVQSVIENAVPVSAELRELPELSLPTFGTAPTAPNLSFPSKPGGLNDSVPSNPGFDAPSIPAVPSYSLPTAPTLTTITIPDTPTFTTLPTFDASAPDTLASPSLPALSFDEGTYTSSLKTAAEAWLADIIANGGTGLAASVEQAIFDRSLTREVDSAHKNLELAADEFAASGFNRPSGALRARLDEIRIDLQKRTDDLNRKIAEDQAKLAQDNTQFAISESLRHEAVLLQHFNAIQDRALRYAVAIVDAAREVYNLRVTEYQARWDGYKAEAQVFAERLRAAVIEVDRFKAQVDVELAKAEVDKAAVERYRVQVQAVQLVADFYRTQLEGAKVTADIEALNLQAFRAEVDAFSASVAAKRAEYDAYEAGVRGETAKVDAYRAQVDGFRASNDAEKIKVDAQRSAIDAAIADNRGRLDAYRADIDFYRAQIEQNSGAIRSAVAAFAAKSDVYRAEIDRSRTQNEVNKFNTELALKAAEWNQGQLNETYRLQGQLLTQQINAAIAGASSAVSGLSTMGAAIASQINTISQIANTEDVSA